MQYLEPNELLAVLKAAKDCGAREWAMFVLAYRHGLRASEISNLTLADVRGGKLNVRRVKDSLHTIQALESHSNPLLDEKAALYAWLRERGDADGSQFVFTSRQGSGVKRRQVYNLFNEVAFRAGIDETRRNPHILKHSLAAHLIRAGVGVAHVQQVLGHRDPKSTLAYTHITQSEAAVAANKVMDDLFTR